MSRMFRQAMLSPAAEQLSKSIESGTWRQAPYVSLLWNTDSQSVTDTLTHRIGVIVNDDQASGAMAVKPSKSSGEIQLMTKSQGAVWTANSPSAWVCTGFIGGQLLETGSVKLRVGELPDQFGSVTLVTLDDQPITHSKRMLVTAAGRSENVGMGWNEDRTSVGSKWGQGPVQIVTVPAVITIDANVAKKVYVLNSRGERTQQLPLRRTADQIEFEMAPVHQTVWYEITD